MLGFGLVPGGRAGCSDLRVEKYNDSKCWMNITCTCLTVGVEMGVVCDDVVMLLRVVLTPILAMYLDRGLKNNE